MTKVISVVGVEEKIFFVRGKKVLFDRDLALLYGVRTKELNKAVARNRARFPQDFMFRLTAQEMESLRFQFGTSRRTLRGSQRRLLIVVLARSLDQGRDDEAIL